MIAGWKISVSIFAPVPLNSVGLSEVAPQ